MSTFTFTHKVELNSFAVLDKRGNWRKGSRGSNRGDGRRHEGGRLNGVFQKSEAVLWMCCSGSRWTRAQFSVSVRSVIVSPVKWRVGSTYLIYKPTVSFVCWLVQPLTEIRRQLKLILSVLHFRSVSFHFTEDVESWSSRWSTYLALNSVYSLLFSPACFFR